MSEVAAPPVTQQSVSSRALQGLMSLARHSRVATDAYAGMLSQHVLTSVMSAFRVRDPNTLEHSRRTSKLAMGMAQQVGWTDENLKRMEVAALLHDIGKLGIPEHILFKPGKLSPEEVALMGLQRHIGRCVLQACHADAEMIDVITTSHEHFENITQRRTGAASQGAKILAVADAYDSLSTDQVYRKAMPHDEIMKLLMESAGSKFDGNIVCALSRWVGSDGVPGADQTEIANDETLSQCDPNTSLMLCQIFSYLYVLESQYDGFYVLDADRNVVVWSVGIERLLGRPSAAVMNNPWTPNLVKFHSAAGRPLEADACPLEQAINQLKASSDENLQIINAAGQLHPVEVQSLPLMDSEGKFFGVAQIFRNMDGSSETKEYRDLKLQATQDALTQVANRGELESQLGALLRTYEEESEHSFSVIFLDVDHFKNINDTFGHTVGDEVLIEVARLLKRDTYSGELVGRYGGEEFVIICPETDLEHAVQRADRLRHSVSVHPISGLGTQRVTASFGVTEVEPGDALEDILQRADQALYEAKETGRNCTRWKTNLRQVSLSLSTGTPVEEETDSFVFEGAFEAIVAADMIVYKLGGFVNDEGCKLVDVSGVKAKIQCGTPGFLGRWGKREDKQPVEVEIEFVDLEDVHSGRRPGNRPVEIHVEIKPLGKVRNAEIFQARANSVFNMLRSYFVSS